jgi:hypothetical protein
VFERRNIVSGDLRDAARRLDTDAVCWLQGKWRDRISRGWRIAPSLRTTRRMKRPVEFVWPLNAGSYQRQYAPPIAQPSFQQVAAGSISLPSSVLGFNHKTTPDSVRLSV